METASLAEIKKELKTLTPLQLQEIIARLGRFKKENKELLTYLLFEAADDDNYIRICQEEIDSQFLLIRRSRLRLIGKTLRKILKYTNKQIRFTGSKKVEAELLIHFLQNMKKMGYGKKSRREISGIYNRQLERAIKAVLTLHEDLRYDYVTQLEDL